MAQRATDEKENMMRKVIASPFVTLDGFIAGPHGELDWAIGGEEFDREMLPLLLKRVDAIVLGRVTYQELAAYWPSATTDDDINVELMNTVPKIVFSRTLEQVEWGKWRNARLVKDDPAEVIAHLKQQPGKDMVIFGSGRLVSQLAQAGLIDEYQLRVHPVVLGSGKPLFTDLKEPVKLKLLAATPLSEGVVVLHYQRATQTEPH
jgi:dihydrofolate reductase